MGARLTLTEGHAPSPLKAPAHGHRLHHAGSQRPGKDLRPAARVCRPHGTTTVREAMRTRDHSELALRAFGAKLTARWTPFPSRARRSCHAIDAVVPGRHLFRGIFPLRRRALPGLRTWCSIRLGLNPTRAALLDVLTALGRPHQRCSISKRRMPNSSARSRSRAGGRPGLHCNQRGARRPAHRRAARPRCHRALHQRRHPHSRRQRTARQRIDRIALVARISAPWAPKSRNSRMASTSPADRSCMVPAIDSGGDHRIAMAFSVAALRAEGDTLIQGRRIRRHQLPGVLRSADLVAEPSVAAAFRKIRARRDVSIQAQETSRAIERVFIGLLP